MSNGRRYRVSVLALLALLALIVSACAVSTVDPGGTSTGATGTVRPRTPSGHDFPSTSATAKVSLSKAGQQLAGHRQPGEEAAVVQLPGGFEGVLFDQVGHLRFFSSVDGMHWGQDQTGTYVYNPDDAKGQHLTVTGAVLDGQKNATFILHGIFTGDGSGRYMAYTVGASGWGPVARHWDPTVNEPIGTKLFVDVALPSAASNEQVSYLGLSFSHGELVETGCSADVATAECGAPGTTYTAWWRWSADEQLFLSAQ